MFGTPSSVRPAPAHALPTGTAVLAVIARSRRLRPAPVAAYSATPIKKHARIKVLSDRRLLTRVGASPHCLCSQQHTQRIPSLLVQGGKTAATPALSASYSTSDYAVYDVNVRDDDRGLAYPT